MVVCPVESVTDVVEQKCDHEADASLARGKRHLICGELQDAIDAFSESCEILSKKHGQTSEHLATPYLYYGKSLLQMARVENGVLGHAVKDGAALAEDDKEEGETAEEAETDPKSTSIEFEDVELPEGKKEEIRNDVQHAMREGNLYNDQLTEDEATEDEGEATQDDEEEPPAKKTTKADSASESKPEEDEKMEQDDAPLEKIEEGKEVPAKPEAKPEEEESSDDVTTMQLAWEMLELAFNIFTKLGPDACMKQAECKHLLGQVSMEKEHYSQAVADFIESYELQRKVLQEGDRRIAESCYSVGLAYSFDKQFPESITWYRKAVTALEARTLHLEQKLKQRACEEYGEAHKSDMYNSMQKEVDELKDLVVLDMRTKIEDVELCQKHYTDSINVMKTMGKDVFSGAHQHHFDQEMPTNGAAQDITHKIQKKRKSETETQNDIKKQKNATDAPTPRSEQTA